jgi:hypothetical protein
MTVHLAATGLDVNGIWQSIQAFMGSYQKMFPGLADLCKTARVPFMTIAALMLMCAFGMRFIRARVIEAQVLHVVSAMVFVTLVCTSPQLLLMTSQGFVDLANQMAPNSSLDGLNRQVDGMLANYVGAKAAQQAGGSTADPGDMRQTKANGDWGWFQFLNPDTLGQKFNEGWAAVQAALIQFAQLAIVVVFKGCLFIAMCAELFQYLVLQFSSIFLPAFVAMIALGGLSGNGVRFVLGLIAVCAWPLAWALGCLGTQGMLNSIQANVGDPASGPMEYLWAGVLMCAVPIWLAVAYIVGPFMAQRMVATGGNAVTGMLATAAGATAGLGAAAAGAVTMGAATVLGGLADGVNAASRMLAGALGGSTSTGAAAGGGGRTASPGGPGGGGAAGGRGGGGLGGYSSITELARASAEQTNAYYAAAARGIGSLADEAAEASGMSSHGLRASEIMAGQLAMQRRAQRNRR